MPVRQPWPLWTVAAAFLLVSLSTGLLARRLLRRADPFPHTVRELHQRLQQLEPALHVVQVTDADEEAGVYLCTTPQPREQLWRLLRAAECARHWQGVVLCTREGKGARIPESILDSWGEHGMQLGDFLFFGDPAVLESIRTSLVPGPRAEPGLRFGQRSRDRRRLSGLAQVAPRVLAARGFAGLRCG